MNDRDVLLAQLAWAKVELSYAGPVRRRDLCKFIRRLEKKLRVLNKIAAGKTAQRGGETYPLSRTKL